MNKYKEEIDFGLDYLSDLADDLTKGECDLSVYPSAMRAVLSKVLGAFTVRSRQARMMKLNHDTFALQWVEPHPETLSSDEYFEHVYSEKPPRFQPKTKQFEKMLQQFLRRQEKMLPARERELLLSRQEALLLLTALYIPNEFLPDLEAALL
jgi:hypothetical protein